MRSMTCMLCGGAVAMALSLAACEREAAEVGMPTDQRASSPVGEVAESATIRLVNLWVDDGTGAPIDVTSKPMLEAETPLFQGVEFGTLTETTKIPADTWLYVYRAGETDGEELGGLFLTSRDLKAGNRLTLVVSYHAPITEGGGTVGISVFYDTGDYVTGSMPVRPVDGALLVADVGPATRVLGESRQVLTFGSPGAGCLRLAGSPPRQAGPGAISVSAGGTAVVTYDVPPGTVRIAAWGDGHESCGGAPRVGPVEAGIDPSGRTYVFVYGTGPDDLRLLTVPASSGS